MIDGLLPMQPRFPANISSINLASYQIYHGIDVILLASFECGCGQHLLVIGTISRGLNQTETAKYVERIIIDINIIIIIIIFLFIIIIAIIIIKLT